MKTSRPTIPIPREIADWSPNPEQMYNQAELKDILSRNIQGLPASFRTVFVLRDVEGLSTEETAEALQLSVPAVKSRLLRARLQLRERLNRYFKRKRTASPSRDLQRIFKRINRLSDGAISQRGPR